MGKYPEGYTCLSMGANVLDLFKLVSVKKGQQLPSIIFDSLGTKKIVSLAGYLVECLSRGGILIIDELDSGLHFKMTRAIISLFNSSVNEHAQLIFSTHDVSLLDKPKAPKENMPNC